MFVCYDLCGLIFEYFDKNLKKYHINKRFLDKNGTRIINVSVANLEKYSKKGNLEVVKWLLSKGIDITTTDNYAFCLASGRGHLNVVKYLLSKGAYVPNKNNQAVCFASEHGHLNVVKFLVSKGADYTNAVSSARWNGHSNVIKFLVSKGARL